MKISQARTVFVSELPTSQYRWGYMQFPRLNRTADGKILLTVSNNIDVTYLKNTMGAAPALLSSDDGNSFTDITGHTGLAQMKLRRFFCGGERFEFPLCTAQSVDAQPVAEGKHTPYGGREKAPWYALYNTADLPERFRSIPMRINDVPTSVPVHGMEHLVALDSEFDYVKAERIRFDRQVQPLNLSVNAYYVGQIEPFLTLKDRVLLVLSEPMPEDGQLLRAKLSIFESTDHCRSFHVISHIFPDTPLGLCGEFALQEFCGQLHIIARTRLHHDMNYPHYLAHYVSADMGYHWKQLKPVSQCSVTPWLLRGEHEMLALYGRPGIYFRRTLDGENWSESTALLGPDERTLPDPFPQHEWDEVHHKYSCCNITAMALDKGKYLIAYSDFRYDIDGVPHKAIKVRTVECE